MYLYLMCFLSGAANDKKSVAFSLIFNGISYTLKDEDVMKSFNKIINEIKNKHNGILRDN